MFSIFLFEMLMKVFQLLVQECCGGVLKDGYLKRFLSIFRVKLVRHIEKDAGFSYVIQFVKNIVVAFTSKIILRKSIRWSRTASRASGHSV